MATPKDEYSQTADRQLDALQVEDPVAYEHVLTTCELVFDEPAVAQANSSAIQTPDGIVMALPVRRLPGYKVFWTTERPRVEAVFKYDFS